MQRQATLPGIGKHTGFHIVFKLEDVMQRRRAQRNTKRVRVSVQVKGHGGKVHGSADIEVEMPLSEVLSYVVTPREQQEPAGTEEAVRDQLEEEFEREAADEEIEVATQACQVAEDEVEGYVRDIDVDSEVGQNYFRLWQQGWITDEMVTWRWGLPVSDKFREKGKCVEEDQDQLMLNAVLVAEDLAGSSQRDVEPDEMDAEGQEMDVMGDAGGLPADARDERAEKGEEENESDNDTVATALDGPRSEAENKGEGEGGSRD